LNSKNIHDHFDIITCKNCGNCKLSFNELIHSSQKEISGAIPGLVGIHFKKNAINASYVCNICNWVSVYPLKFSKK